MRWRSGRRSSNIEDQRGRRISRKAKGGGIGIMLLALVGMYFGIDPSVVLNIGNQLGGGQAPTTTSSYQPTADENQLADFVAVVLGDTEDTWRQEFSKQGGTYREPKLVLFSGAVKSACGFAQAAMGPFYCPGDPTRLVITSRTCSVSATRCIQPKDGFRRRSTINCRCGLNCRPIACPGSGPTTPIGPGRWSNRGISTKP